MSLFDRLVDEALRNDEELAPLRVVVEKELLHHDVMLALSAAGLPQVQRQLSAQQALTFPM